jgi:excisionase family DNA binding protein
MTKKENDPCLFMKPIEIARIINVSPATVTAWIHSGLVPALRFGDSWRIRKTDVARMLKEGIPSDK